MGYKTILEYARQYGDGFLKDLDAMCRSSLLNGKKLPVVHSDAKDTYEFGGKEYDKDDVIWVTSHGSRIAILESDGTVLSDTVPEMAGTKVSDKPYFKAAKAEKTFYAAEKLDGAKGLKAFKSALDALEVGATVTSGGREYKRTDDGIEYAGTKMDVDRVAQIMHYGKVAFGGSYDVTYPDTGSASTTETKKSDKKEEKKESATETTKTKRTRKPRTKKEAATTGTVEPTPSKKEPEEEKKEKPEEETSEVEGTEKDSSLDTAATAEEFEEVLSKFEDGQTFSFDYVDSDTGEVVRTAKFIRDGEGFKNAETGDSLSTSELGATLEFAKTISPSGRFMRTEDAETTAKAKARFEEIKSNWKASGKTAGEFAGEVNEYLAKLPEGSVIEAETSSGEKWYFKNSGSGWVYTFTDGSPDKTPYNDKSLAKNIVPNTVTKLYSKQEFETFRKAEETRKAKEARKAEEARKAAEEARKAAEEARKAEREKEFEDKKAKTIEEKRRNLEDAEKSYDDARKAALAERKAHKEEMDAYTPTTVKIGWSTYKDSDYGTKVDEDEIEEKIRMCQRRIDGLAGGRAESDWGEWERERISEYKERIARYEQFVEAGKKYQRIFGRYNELVKKRAEARKNIERCKKELEHAQSMTYGSNPKTLEKYDEHAEKFAKTHWADMSESKKAELQAAISDILSHTRCAMRCEPSTMGAILKTKAKNQIELQEEGINKSGGTHNPLLRASASRTMFGHELPIPTGRKTPEEKRVGQDYETYGYAANENRDEEFAKYGPSQYGSCVLYLKKENFEGALTYSTRDSLGSGSSGTEIPGKVENGVANIYGVWSHSIYANRIIEASKKHDYSNVSGITGASYWEYQYHKPVTIDDVEEILFRSIADYQDADPKMLAEAKKRGIRIGYHDSRSKKTVEV